VREFAAAQSQTEKNWKKTACDNDEVTWPDVPYHYGMGRIKAYEEWLARLSETDRQKEIAACRARYEAYYHTVADELVNRMSKLGYDLEPFRARLERGRGGPEYER
jgi:hypothetical protein